MAAGLAAPDPYCTRPVLAAFLAFAAKHVDAPRGGVVLATVAEFPDGRVLPPREMALPVECLRAVTEVDPIVRTI
jgi:hypothetical protein